MERDADGFWGFVERDSLEWRHPSEPIGEPAIDTDRRDVFVVHFYSTRAGELRCRVTEPWSHDHWTVADATSLLRLLAREAPQRQHSNPTLTE